MPLKLKGEPRFTPRIPRISARLPTTVLMPDDREIEVRVKNISRDGFMAEASERLAEGTCFGIDIPGRGILRAQVRWTDGRTFGARFHSMLQIREIECGESD